MSKKIIYPDYSHCLVNLLCSVRKYFNCEYNHETLPLVDKILEERKPRTVMILLLDGCGSKIIEHHLDIDGLMRTHKIDDLLSTFPATTVAATTAVRTGNTPIENGWLGWHQYVEKLDDDIIMFRGQSYYTDNKYDHDIGYEIEPYKTIFEDIREKGYMADEIFPPFGKDKIARSLPSMLRKARRYIKQSSTKQYLYCYWGEPDHSMHKYGTDSKKITKMLTKFEKKLVKLERKMPEDAICFVIADHGHINVEEWNICSYPDFYETLLRKPSLESRNMTFYVKEDKKEQFVELFNKYFGEEFKLFSKEEALSQNLFGDGPNKERSFKYIGDYHCVGIGNHSLVCKENFEPQWCKAAHAGITEDEMLVPLIQIIKKKRK